MSPPPRTIAEIQMRRRLLAAGDAAISEVAGFFEWGGRDSVKDATEFTAEELLDRGWTAAKLIDLAEGYEWVARITPDNPSAEPRAIQLKQLAELLESEA